MRLCTWARRIRGTVGGGDPSRDTFFRLRREVILEVMLWNGDLYFSHHHLFCISSLFFRMKHQRLLHLQRILRSFPRFARRSLHSGSSPSPSESLQSVSVWTWPSAWRTAATVVGRNEVRRLIYPPSRVDPPSTPTTNRSNHLVSCSSVSGAAPLPLCSSPFLYIVGARSSLTRVSVPLLYPLFHHFPYLILPSL